MKQQFALQPYAGMGKGRPGYRAKIIGRTESQGRCLEDIARAAAKDVMQADLMLLAFRRVMNEAIRGAVETGEIQRFDTYGSLMLNIHGSFDGIDDTFDGKRHSLDFRFVPGAALKGLQPRFSLENVVSRKAPVVYEVAPYGNVGQTPAGLTRYAVRGHAICVTVDAAKMASGGTADWEVETSDRKTVTGRFEIIESDAAHLALAWPTSLPTALRKSEFTLVLTTRNGQCDATPLIRRTTVTILDVVNQLQR